MAIHLSKSEIISIAVMWVSILVAAATLIDTSIVRVWMIVSAVLVTAVVVGRGRNVRRRKR